MKKFGLTILIILLTIIGTAAFSQKVALVLSGGGAKAFAHIGVLRALEENNIPVDYIVANSIGSVIGGLYASGYSPEEIEKILSDPRLYIFRQGDVKSDKYLFQSSGDNASIVRIPFSVEKGFQLRLPFNVYNIQEFDYLLMEYLAGPSAAAGYDFDSLMIPFRCVATDIDSSRMLVLKDGDLAKAVRASMTFPFFIRPVKLDDKLLFDGGMYDNFPVNTAEKVFRPDFIIGSKAVDNYVSPDENDIVSQMTSMLMKKADFNIDSARGLLIETKSGNENIFNFQEINSYIDSGYVAALRKIPLLKEKIAKKQSAAAIEKMRKNFQQSQPELVIDEVRVKGVNGKQEVYFMKSFRVHKEDENADDYKKQYTRLLANENVLNAYPSLHFNDSSRKFDLTLDIKEVTPFALQFGGFISSTGVNEGFVSFGYRHLGKTYKSIEAGAYFGTFYNSVWLDGKWEVQGRLPVVLRAKFLASGKNYFSNSRYFFEDKSPAFVIIDENYFDLSAGIPIGLSHALKFGATKLNLNTTYYQNNYFTRTDTADQSNFYFLNPYIEFTRNSLNRKQFATKGSRFFLGLNYYSGNEHTIPGTTVSGVEEYVRDLEFLLLSVHYEQYFQVFKPFILGATADFSVSNKPLLGNYVSSLLLASSYEPTPLMETMFLENYRAYSFGGLGVKFIFELLKSLELRIEGNYFVPYRKMLRGTEDYSVTLSAPFSYQYIAGTVQLVYHSPIGPISASVNYFERPGEKFSFFLGIGYLIFNKSRFYR
ncbi:MAG: patatin-like phospholipase family protein [Bacteroidales bacterium]|nr:patatin-like phospholipase family protein [Bacteroidales bacterium]